MKASHIIAVVVILGAGAWIGSGVVGREHPEAEKTEAADAKATPRFRVSVVETRKEDHARRIVLSGRTEADRRVTVAARANGTVIDLKVRRGSVVKTGDVIAVLSDEAREAIVAQASAKLEQRRAELKARLTLIEQGNMASLQKPSLEAELRAAEAGLAQAEAERDKSKVRAPIDGIVNAVPIEKGQALQVGAAVADVVSMDPMLAVVEVAERQLAGIRVGDRAMVRLVSGGEVDGKVRFVSTTASPQTRTYRVDVEIANPKGVIPDGVTSEVMLDLAPVPATRVPRSALTFSNEGRLGVRTVGKDGVVAFSDVIIVQDGREQVWLKGVPDGAAVIVQGQDFVKEGEVVEAVPAGTLAKM
ncbi:efflux RND transporter periplasmic adaptor subunit [Chelatococcus asaccharovorans]|uniref:Multidrug efflux system membrane fusion protein n=1 Tax=Chelatococcus asaccharovorans TaxID=28210 RepID=A0A2V3U937_9HYPH|nr:efflux RND transporter periplasmic adaptor subunit [Chelatococcus asaccharovorans]MBS7704624.1 efflux RND transporter periplasmic adaptor subunit [Chelatococcus asaccharovorans]PXW54525.1 multidrug efflux system membrane fusion protein [Chelatococcus asaccharovorans]CAH1648811.1 Multidrug efflux system membrane fusion protein [Chelatococcus asaccharovorans]CAH1687361.1 Multidrug efflux system membrane fusion protein [Chelatococcus asaccharovorans]